jgi:hypothetical protein
MPSFLSAAGELRGSKDIRRLVDEIAREHHAFSHGLGRREQLSRGLRVGAVHHDFSERLVVGLVGWAVLLGELRLVLSEFVTAQHDAERKVGDVGRRDLASGALNDDVRRRSFLAGQEAAHRAAEVEPIFAAVLRCLPCPDHDNTGKVETVGSEQVDIRFLFALEAADLHAARHETLRCLVEILGHRWKLRTLLGDHRDHALFGHIEIGKGNRSLISHPSLPRFFQLAPSKHRE